MGKKENLSLRDVKIDFKGNNLKFECLVFLGSFIILIRKRNILFLNRMIIMIWYFGIFYRVSRLSVWINR